ncbi:MAG TPA: sensor histidine kinase, partial [Candidatus Pelethocola excrementipullorum]|nr:sensor histidine kinase [Candidatus Pelethocola excrementipullorum]
ITIRVALDGNDILMQVQDNGQGMTEEQTATILQKERSDDSGIGLKNVNDRIKIYFGEEYGISIDSELDCGTTISIRFPIIVTQGGDKIEK